jgi:hypothetical protein
MPNNGYLQIIRTRRRPITAPPRSILRPLEENMNRKNRTSEIRRI